MIRIKKIIIVTTGLFILFLRSARANTIPLSPIHALTNPQNANFYGTALFFDSTDDRYAFFLTNAHILPNSSRPSDLKISGPLTNDVEIPIEIIGRSWGHDLAVIRIKISDSITNETLLLTKSHTKLMMSPYPQNEPVRFMHFGVADSYQFRPGFFSLAKEDWNESVSILAAQPAPEHSEDHLYTSKDCPQPFLTRCYISDLPSWGFSGAAHLVEDTQTHGKKFRRIVGIVSNFEFLSEVTIVIPIEIALEIGDKIVAQGRDIIFDREQDPNFEILDQYRIRVLKGPLKNVIISQAASNTPTGGGDLAGGGIGGDLAGGGGFLGSEQKFKDNFQKSLWIFLNFNPGIFINKNQFHSAWVPNKNYKLEITQISDFVRAYQKDPDLVLNEDLLKFDLPESFSSYDLGLRSEFIPERETRMRHSAVSVAIWDRSEKAILYSTKKIEGGQWVSTPTIIRYDTEMIQHLSSQSTNVQLSQVRYREGQGPILTGKAFVNVHKNTDLKRTLIRFFFISDVKDNAHLTQNLIFRSR